MPIPTIHLLPSPQTNDNRREAILGEVIDSQAEITILLGDLPIRWFLYFLDNRWKKLSDFDTYGQLHDVQILNGALKVLPIAHPRQIAKLGNPIKEYP